jgi:RNA-binding protein
MFKENESVVSDYNTLLSLNQRREQMDNKTKKALKARAHHLNPVVIVGDKGLSKAVLKEIDVALKAHELIKIKLQSDDREERRAMGVEICDKLAAHPIGSIGKIVVIYRENIETDSD